MRGGRNRPICHRVVRVTLGRAWDGGRSGGVRPLGVGGLDVVEHRHERHLSRREFSGEPGVIQTVLALLRGEVGPDLLDPCRSWPQ